MLTLLSRDVSVGSGDTLDGLMPLQLMDDADADGRFEIVGVPQVRSRCVRSRGRGFRMPFDPASQRFIAPRMCPPLKWQCCR
jgi:hypothetical protein